MNNTWSWLVVVGFALAWLVFTRLGKISSAKAHELVASGAILIDVRTVAEFASSHLPGARNLPLHEPLGNAVTRFTARSLRQA